MSGLCGLIRLDGAVPSAERVAQMAAAVPHRGSPRIWHDAHAVIAHLATSPERPPGEPDESRAAGSVAVVADVRLDNRMRLERELVAADHPGPGDFTDADLILAGYRRWGTEVAARLVGDFAFVIWDADAERLFAARDPMGMRSLYYRLEPARCLFATELHQLLVVDGVPTKLAESKVAAYLVGSDGAANETFYSGISRLPPGHSLLVSREGASVARFWDIDPDTSFERLPEPEQEERFREVFVEAVRSRLVGTAPVGILLSGGLDSGSVASAAGWLHRHEGRASGGLISYSWAHSEFAESDERATSRLISSHYEIPEKAIEADELWPLSEYSPHSPHPDDPYFAVYQPMFDRALGAAQSDGVSRMLTGDRGDEMVGDWVFDYVSPIWRLRWWSLYRELGAHARMESRSRRSVIRQYIAGPLAEGVADRLPGRTTRSARRRRHDLPAWVHPDLVTRTQLGDRLHDAPKPPGLGYPREVRYQRIFSPVGVRVAVWADRTRAVYGVEHADPWSDRRVAETIVALPPRTVQRAGSRKRIIRAALGSYYPAPALAVASKTEPTGLFDRGFRDRAKKVILDLIDRSVAAEYGFVDAAELRAAYQSYLDGKPVRHDFWWPLTLEIWLRRYW